MNAVEWELKAAKQLRRLDRPQQARIRDAVKTLRNFPDCHNIKQLTRHRYPYRLRCGRYRIFFQFEETIRIITIEEVKKRDERTY